VIKGANVLPEAWEQLELLLPPNGKILAKFLALIGEGLGFGCSGRLILNEEVNFFPNEGQQRKEDKRSRTYW
jgi:hypothetical protein